MLSSESTEKFEEGNSKTIGYLTSVFLLLLASGVGYLVLKDNPIFVANNTAEKVHKIIDWNNKTEKSITRYCEEEVHSIKFVRGGAMAYTKCKVFSTQKWVEACTEQFKEMWSYQPVTYTVTVCK